MAGFVAVLKVEIFEARGKRLCEGVGSQHNRRSGSGV